MKTKKSNSGSLKQAKSDWVGAEGEFIGIQNSVSVREYVPYRNHSLKIVILVFLKYS